MAGEGPGHPCGTLPNSRCWDCLWDTRGKLPGIQTTGQNHPEQPGRQPHPQGAPRKGSEAPESGQAGNTNLYSPPQPPPSLRSAPAAFSRLLGVASSLPSGPALAEHEPAHACNRSSRSRDASPPAALRGAPTRDGNTPSLQARLRVLSPSPAVGFAQTAGDELGGLTWVWLCLQPLVALPSGSTHSPGAWGEASPAGATETPPGSSGTSGNSLLYRHVWVAAAAGESARSSSEDPEERVKEGGHQLRVAGADQHRRRPQRASLLGDGHAPHTQTRLQALPRLLTSGTF